MRALALAAVVVLAAACERAPEEGFRAKTEGVVDVELEGSAFSCSRGAGTLYVLADADREGRIMLARLSHDPPVAGTTYPVLHPDSARERGGTVMWGAPVALTGPDAFRLPMVDSGSVTFEEVSATGQRARFRLFLSYGGLAGQAEVGTISGAFTAETRAECPEDV